MDPSYNNSFGGFGAGQAGVVQQLEGETKGNKRWVFGIVIVVVLVLISLLLVVLIMNNGNKTHLSETQEDRFRELLTYYDDKIGVDLGQLYRGNASSEDVNIVSKDILEELNNLLKKYKEVGDNSNSADYSETIGIIENNVAFLEDIYNAFGLQTELQYEELVTVCGRGDKIKDLLDDFEEDESHIIENYSLSLCIYLASREDDKDEELLDLRLNKAKVIRLLKQIDRKLLKDVDGVSDEK